MSFKTRVEKRFPNLARLYWPCRSLLRVRSLTEVRFLLFYARFVRVSRSQAMQDVFAIWAERNRSSSTAHQSSAFVEVGANEPEIGSNTVMLERRGWAGLLVEPNPALAARLAGARKARVFQLASSDENDKELWLRVPIDASGKANLSETFAEHEADIDIESFRVRTRRLSQMIDEAELSEHSLFLSIDVEGHEFEVLNGIDFLRHTFFAITVEHNFDSERLQRYRVLLRTHGFEQVFPRISCFDAWFVRARG